MEEAIKEFKESQIIIWDRQDKEFKKLRDYHYDSQQKRHYFKHTDCNLALEDKVALDVFIVDDKTRELIPFGKWIKQTGKKSEDKN